MRHKLSGLSALAGSALLLASCGAPEEQSGGAGDLADGAEAASGVAGMSGVAVGIEPLSEDAGADLGPIVSGCDFQYGGETLLVAGASGDSAARGRGVIRAGGRERTLEADRTGGPEYINAGPVLSDGDYSVTVERAESEGDVVGAESIQWPAELVVTNAAGEEWRYTPGTWTCGV